MSQTMPLPKMLRKKIDVHAAVKVQKAILQKFLIEALKMSQTMPLPKIVRQSKEARAVASVVEAGSMIPARISTRILMAQN